MRAWAPTADRGIFGRLGTGGRQGRGARQSRGAGPSRRAGLLAVLAALALAVTGCGPAGADSRYPVHSGIITNVFWVGEIFDSSLKDGSQICSTYDKQWSFHHTGKALGTTPDSAAACRGAKWGGCDGVASGDTYVDFQCDADLRTAANGYFPTTGSQPLQNPFYVALPYDDLNDKTGFDERCSVIPWADLPSAGKCQDRNFSYLKNRWVKITGPNGTCFGQIEDAGPSTGTEYHDAQYVFGTDDARPSNQAFGTEAEGAGLDVSPALAGCVGVQGSGKTDWRFVESEAVPDGPWTRIITTTGVSR